jgi:hypothetical protein
MPSDSENKPNRRPVGRPRRIDYAKLVDQWTLGSLWVWDSDNMSESKKQLARRFGISERHLRRILTKSSSK